MSGDTVLITKPVGSTNFTIEETSVSAGQGYTDAIHLSNASNFTIKVDNIAGGTEDCIDLNNRCLAGVIEDTNFMSGGKYCMTIKGGTQHILVQDCVVMVHGKEVDFDIGNWSDQSDELTEHILFHNVTSADGKPVLIRVLWANNVAATGGNVKLVGIIPFIGTGWLNLQVVKLWRFGRKRNWWGTKA